MFGLIKSETKIENGLNFHKIVNPPNSGCGFCEERMNNFFLNGFFLILSPVCKTKSRKTLSRKLCFFSQFNVAHSQTLSVNWFFPTAFLDNFDHFFSFPFEARNLNSLTSRIWMLSISDIHFPQKRTTFQTSHKNSLFLESFWNICHETSWINCVSGFWLQ